jgi:hypothetical protein
MAPSKAATVEKALVSQLSTSAEGRPASEAVKAVVESVDVDADAVRRAVRVLLESGKIDIGPNLNLIVPTEVKKAG